MTESRLKKYAELLVRVGGNIKAGQPVVIVSDVENAEIARLARDSAYDAGASEVIMEWTDDLSTRAKYLRAADDVFDVFPDWQVDRFKYLDDSGAAYLRIDASDPDLLNGVDPDRIKRYMKVSRTKAKAHGIRVMSGELRWSIIAVPSPKWARKVFPNMEEDKAIEALWDAILKGARADGDDPIADWEKHCKTFTSRIEYLNKKQFSALRFKNSLGTDVTVGLAKNHVWVGGGSTSKDGIDFCPNLPTEEIFTAPDRNNVNGTVVASMPLSYQGSLIEDFSFTFKDGKVVDYKAKNGIEMLKNILETDEGAQYLGEVALVANSSPISQMNVLFYHTLFDENASSHFALGKAYPSCVQGGNGMSEEELLKAGVNDSITHADFMFGTADMSVIGIDADGNETVVMENGELVF